MHADYTDILRRIKQSPVWWDQNGVPRFDPFRPQDSPNIYADEVALLEVECQSCGARFSVEVNSGIWQKRAVLVALVAERAITYGDPPRHDCTGDAMMSVTRRVKEFWKRENSVKEWRRIHGWEMRIRAPKAEVG